MKAARQQCKFAMLAGLKFATEKHLYKRTPLPVTRKMYDSIRVYLEGDAIVGGFITTVAGYIPIRYKMHGKSVTGGHQLDIDPDIKETTEELSFPIIRRLLAAANRKIIGS